MRRTLTPTTILGGLAALAVVAVSIYQEKSGSRPTAASSDSAPQVALVDLPLVKAPDGSPFAMSQLRGSWTVLVFGYMTCPDVCPTTLAYMAREARTLADNNGRVRFGFVSVDPERDQLPALAGYVRHFDEQFFAVTGNLQQLRDFSRSLGAFYAKVEAPESRVGYTMTHSSAFFIIDPAGRFVKSLPPPLVSGALATELARLAGLTRRS